MGKRILLALGLVLALFAAGCTGSAGIGYLEGKVTIGPLCPVEPCNLTQEQIAKIYSSREIVFYSEASNETIAKANLSADGTYRVALPAGRYEVTILPSGIQKYVKTVEISENRTTTLDIYLDTGIR